MNIYVPDDLKTRMDQAEGVNWSPIACQAFESKLADIITMRGAQNMLEAIARLRESKAKSTDAVRLRGQEAGKSWAANKAEFAELNRLDSWTHEKFAGSSWDEFVLRPSEWDRDFGHSRMIARVISGTAGVVRPEIEDKFWQSFDATDRSSGCFLVGFVEGALAFWHQVKDQL